MSLVDAIVLLIIGGAFLFLVWLSKPPEEE